MAKSWNLLGFYNLYNLQHTRTYSDSFLIDICHGMHYIYDPILNMRVWGDLTKILVLFAGVYVFLNFG